MNMFPKRVKSLNFKPNDKKNFGLRSYLFGNDLL